MIRRTAVLLAAVCVLFGNVHAQTISVPTSLNVGSAKVGENATLTLTISNLSITSLNVTGITTDDGQFTVSPTSVTVAGLGSQDVTITFAPTAAGAQSANLSIAHDDAITGSPTSIPLSGTGLQGVVSLGAGSIDFGNVVVGQQSGSQTVTISNTGDADLVVSSVSLSGANTGDFSVSPSSFTVGDGSSQDLTVTFTPSATGARAASIDITHDGVGGSSTVSLDGTGVQPAISLGSPLDFGDVLVGQTSGSLTVTVTNPGTSTLNVSGVALSGANAADFSVSPTSFSVNTGASQDLTVTFTPSATGSRSASIDISHDAPGGSTSLALDGNGIQPAISLSGALDFGDVLVDQTSGSLTVTVSNTGTAALNVSGVAISGTNAADFAVSPTSFSVNTGASQDLTVTFTPSATGSRSASIDITHDAPGSPVSVSLAGNGIQPAISLSGALNFGDVAVGQTSGSLTVTVSNTGTATLNVSGVAISGTNAADFTVSPASFTVADGASQDLTVTFTPGAAGTRSAAIDITHDGPTSPNSVSLSGNGIQSSISLSGALDFGDIAVGETSGSLTVTVSNTGSSTLNVSGVTLSGTNAADFTVMPTTFSVSDGASQDLTVTFTPSAAGARSAAIDIAHDAPGSPSSVSLSGNGIQAAISVVGALDFGDLLVDQTSTDRTITVSNTGTATLTVSAVALSGTNAADFTVTPASFTVATGGNLDLTVTFTPSATGSRSASVDLTHSAPGSPVSVSLAGNGIQPAISVGSLVAFGDVAAGASADVPLTVTNAGTADMTVSAVTLSGANAGDFSASPSSFTVAAGGSQDVTLTFTPAGPGSRAATVSIAHDAPGSPSAVSLSGNGLQPALTLDATSLDFGDVLTGATSQTVDITVTNSGTADLTVSGVSLSGSDAASFAVSTTTFTVAAGASQAVGVTFTPAAAGTRTATVTIAHDGPTGSDTVDLTGRGVAPEFSAPSSVSLGGVAVGQSGQSTISVSNTGTAPLTISAVAVGGTHAAEVAVSPSSASVAVGASQTFTLTFSPAEAGTRTADLTLTHDADGGTTTVALSGSGVVGSIAVAGSLGFDNVAVGGSDTRTLTITNAGSAEVAVSAITLTGTAAADFSAAPTSGTIAGGASLAVTITFTPSEGGTRQATLRIVHDGPGGQSDVALTGTGAEPVISVETSDLDFGTVAVGQSATRSLTLENTGNAVLTVSAIAADGADGADASAFTPSVTSGSIPAGGQLSITVSFTPSDAAAHEADLTITSDGGAPVTVTLSGTAVSASISVPASVDVGDIPVGGSGQAEFVVSNEGTADLTITDVSVSGTGGFTVALAAVTLSPGDSETGVVTFSPDERGAASAEVVISHTAGPDVTVSVTGTGREPALSVSSSVVAFGAVQVGAQKTLTLTLTNVGNADLSITSIDATSAAVTASAAALTIPAGEAVSLDLTYQPAGEGPLTDTVTLRHDGPSDPTQVTVTGQAIGALTADLSLDATVLDFGDVEVGQSAARSVTITNAGLSIVNVTEITASNEAFTAALPGAIGPGASIDVEVVFTPTFDLPHAGTLSILHDGTDPTLELSLAGTGVAVEPGPGIVSFDTNPEIGNQGALSVSAAPGEMFTLALHVRQAAEIGTYRFMLRFDKSQVAIQEVFEFTDGGGDVTVLSTGTDDGATMSIVTSGGGDASERRIVEIDFLVGDAFTGFTSIAIDAASFSTPAGTTFDLDDTWEITVGSATEVSVDFDGSGAVDFGDFILFSGAFGGSDLRFDLDGDGAVGFTDFLVFAEAFTNQ